MYSNTARTRIDTEDIMSVKEQKHSFQDSNPLVVKVGDLIEKKATIALEQKQIDKK